MYCFVAERIVPPLVMLQDILQKKNSLYQIHVLQYYSFELWSVFGTIFGQWEFLKKTKLIAGLSGQHRQLFSVWNCQPWPSRSQNWMFVHSIVILSRSRQFPTSSSQNQVELSEWATGHFIHCCFAGAALFLLVLGTGLAGCFEDCNCNGPFCQNLVFSLNALRPRQNGQHFADDTFKRIFLNENIRILIKISLKFVPKGPINNILALV